MVSVAVGISLAISTFAVLISLVSLWQSHLAPFNLQVTNSSPRFSIYDISKENGDGWWIPSVDLSVTFYNTGKRPGKIKNIRLTTDMPKEMNIQIDGEKIQEEGFYEFQPKWIVDYNEYESNFGNRFQWLRTSLLSDWYAIILGGDGEKSAHIVFEDTRLDEKIEGQFEFCLEVVSDSSDGWVEIDRYQCDIWENLYEGSSFTMTSAEELIEMTEGIEAEE